MPSKTADPKLAQTDYDIHDLIKRRWSPRAFSDKPVEPDLLRQLFDAARWAPSCYNEQPWRFIAATQDHPEEFERISQVLNEKNQQWATAAPVLLINVAKDTFDMDGRANNHAEHDLGQAMAHLTFEATRHDLFVHQMAGILPEKARELYDIPQDYTPLTMAAIGYLGEPRQLPEAFRDMETAKRNRLPVNDIVTRGSWNDSKPI